MEKKKNINKKNINKKKENSAEKKQSLGIYGIIVLAFGLLILLSIFTNKTGIVGSMLKSIIFSFMGIGAYFFTLITILLGIILIFDGNKFTEKKSFLYLILVFIFLLIIYDNINPIDLSFVERIENSIDLGLEGRGGGILGSIFGFFMYKLFGTIGTYLITGLLIILYFFTITSLKPRNIVKRIYLKLREKKKTKAKKQRKTKTNHDKKIKELESKTKLSPTFSNEVIEDLEGIKDEPLPINKTSETGSYMAPALELLKKPDLSGGDNNEEERRINKDKIEEIMKNFGIEAEVTNVNPGPTITCYELAPSPGIKISRILSLADNISLSLASSDIRIEAPIPGKSAIGIEVPNKIKSDVLLREIIESDQYREIDSQLPMALGKNVSGEAIVSSIDKMPHLLIAGATGSGKSVCINTIILSIIYKSPPEDVKLMLIDPKVVELSVYNGIPHLLIPVVTDAKKASAALNWAVVEMENRYKTFAKNNVRDISAYNTKVENKEDRMSKMVIIIDELADLMMVAAQEIEDYICRLAQMARAAGIYLIVATQRPSVDVITGTIKANIPSRISFAVSSQIDSRTILDISGAEKLLGKGDMLFFPSSYSKPVRLQGSFVSDEEVVNIVNSFKVEDKPEYDEKIIEALDNIKEIKIEDEDDLFSEAVALVIKEGQASISYLQRKLKIGYARAGRLIDSMEEQGIVSGAEGTKPRKVLISQEEFDTINRGD